MKVPMKWLREYVDINMGGEEYASKMIMTGTAVEGVEKTGTQFDNVVVGKVLTCVDHPNSDHLHICMVDVGKEEPIQIVCGAPNVHAGRRASAGRREDQEGQDARGGFLRYAVLWPRAGCSRRPVSAYRR